MMEERRQATYVERALVDNSVSLMHRVDGQQPAAREGSSGVKMPRPTPLHAAALPTRRCRLLH
jgi:hypothetical protein